MPGEATAAKRHGSRRTRGEVPRRDRSEGRDREETRHHSRCRSHCVQRTAVLNPIIVWIGRRGGVGWVGGSAQRQLDYLWHKKLLSMWNTDSQYIIYVSLYSAFNGPFCQMSVVRSFKSQIWSSSTRNREAANGKIPSGSPPPPIPRHFCSGWLTAEELRSQTKAKRI